MKWKNMKVVFIFIFFVVVLVGCGKDKSNYILEDKSYDDIIMVQLDVRVIINDGLYYLEKDNKIISKGYQEIKSLDYEWLNEDTFSKPIDLNKLYIDGPITNYFLAKSFDYTYCILNGNGEEDINLTNQYLEFPILFEGGMVGKTTDDKYVYVNFKNGESETLYDKIVDKNKFLIAINNSQVEGSSYTFISYEGEVLLDNIDSISFLKTGSYTHFYSVKIGDKYKLTNDKGILLSEDSYDNIINNSSLDVIMCTENINYLIVGNTYNGERLTYFNNEYQSIIYDTIDSYGNSKPLPDINSYFITYNDDISEKDVVETFSGKKIYYDEIIGNKYIDGDNIGFFNNDGI